MAPHDEVSLLVEPDDIEGLTEALIRILCDGELQERLRSAGRERWRRYAWPAVARQFLNAVGPV